MMDIKTIEQLAELMEQHCLAELEFEQNGAKVKLTKGCCSENNTVKVATPQKTECAAAEKRTAEYIISPLVGTFYRSSAPDAPPFVTEGTRVQPGTVVCIVEAMKVMNEIKAEKAGVISKVLLENSSPVEYGQNLFEIEEN